MSVSFFLWVRRLEQISLQWSNQFTWRYSIKLFHSPLRYICQALNWFIQLQTHREINNIINKHGNLIWIVYDVERHIDENSIIFHKRYRLFAFHQPFETDKFAFILNSFHSIHISSGLLDRWLSWSLWIVFKLESSRRRQLHSPANSKRTIGQSISNNYGMCLKWKQKHSTLDSGLIIAISCALASFCRVGFYDLIYLNRDVNLLWY